MATATKARPTHTRTLREDLARATAPFAVDRAAGVIKGVKVLGRTSPNSHGLKGVTGTEYTLEAMHRARGLYESVSVNKNHPPRETPGRERVVGERIGWLTNVEVREDGIYADLNLLLADPDTGKLLEAAERNPRLFALSHNALGKGEVRGGVYVITDIPEVRSVDVVTDGGTTRSLRESQERPVAKTTLRKLIESKKGKAGKALKTALLEMDDAYPDMEMEAPGAALDEGDWKQSLVDAVGKLVSSGDEADHKTAQKIMALLKPEAAETETPTTEEDDSEEDKDKDKAAETKESRERRCKALCDLAGLRPEAELLESLGELATDGARVKLLASIKKLAGGQQPAGKGAAPRSSATVPVTESREGTLPAFADARSRLSFLRSGAAPIANGAAK